ncbi:hypothetical protein EBS40_07010, partial [bacterium]|nr:hypothetical protein [bacterium]
MVDSLIDPLKNKKLPFDYIKKRRAIPLINSGVSRETRTNNLKEYFHMKAPSKNVSTFCSTIVGKCELHWLVAGT